MAFTAKNDDNVSIMLTVHAMWAGNRQPPYGQNCGTLKDDTSCTMIALCLHLKFCYAYQVIGAGVFELSGETRNYVQKSLYGGRVAGNQTYMKQVIKGEKIEDFDVRSLYPKVQATSLPIRSSVTMYAAENSL